MHLPYRTINEAFSRLPEVFTEYNTYTQASRNGDVIRLRDPLMVTYLNPFDRVLHAPRRDPNPFFHLFESIWMLAGSDRVANLTHYNSRMKDFSNDGRVFSGAYGFRWRKHFGTDQLRNTINELRKDPTTRRVVMQMYDPKKDQFLPSKNKDIPCNLSIVFNSYNGRNLDMTVTNRSNDMIWGMYGANVFHFSFLQQFVTEACGMLMGRYHHVSANAHIYEFQLRDIYKATLQELCEIKIPDEIPLLVGTSLLTHPEQMHDFLQDCADARDVPNRTMEFRTPYFKGVVRPVLTAFDLHKDRKYEKALEVLQQCYDLSLSADCTRWITKRMEMYKNRS